MSLQDRLQSMLGAEEFSEVTVAIPVEDQAVVLADSDVAIAETTVAEHEKEITEIQHDINTVEERLDDIEENVSGLEGMLAGEIEWNPALALRMYNDARKLTERNFGQPEEVFAVDGLESFADASAAQLVIIDGLEDIKEKAKAAGTAIVNFFKNLYKSVIAAFVGLFDRLKGIEKRSDALVSKLSSLSDDKIKDTIQLGKWNAYLRIETSKNPLQRVANVSDKAEHLGQALNASKGESAMNIIDNVLNAIGNMGENKKTVTSTAEQTTSISEIAYIEFRWVVPKVLSSLRNASLSYRIAENAKTSGEYKSGYGKAMLINTARAIKLMARSSQAKTFSASSLNSFREKAINAVKSIASRGDERKEAQAIRAAHVASNNIGRVLTRYQGDVLTAGQQFIAAHF